MAMTDSREHNATDEAAFSLPVEFKFSDGEAGAVRIDQCVNTGDELALLGIAWWGTKYFDLRGYGRSSFQSVRGTGFNSGRGGRSEPIRDSTQELFRQPRKNK
jgi:hypothetical protein